MDARKSRFLIVIALIAALAGCASGPAQKLHHRVVEGELSLSETHQKLLLLPLSVDVKELSVGGVNDADPEWTDRARQHINAALVDSGPYQGKLEIVSLPQLSNAEQTVLDEHIALFDIVGGAAAAHTMLGPGVPAWRHKSEHFDYTIGPGLAFLREKTGADKALVLFGEDVVSSSGRKAAFVVAAAFGVGIPMGHSFLIGGLLDLKSGDVLWLNYTLSTSARTLLNRDDVNTVLTELFREYPALKSQTVSAQQPE